MKLVILADIIATARRRAGRTAQRIAATAAQFGEHPADIERELTNRLRGYQTFTVLGLAASALIGLPGHNWALAGLAFAATLALAVVTAWHATVLSQFRAAVKDLCGIPDDPVSVSSGLGKSVSTALELPRRKARPAMTSQQTGNKAPTVPSSSA